MPKLDLLKEYKNYYKAGKKPEIQEFGEVPYLTVDGQGEPGGEIFTKKVVFFGPFCLQKPPNGRGSAIPNLGVATHFSRLSRSARP